MREEDEDALEEREDGKQVVECEDVIIDRQQAKYPRHAQQGQQNYCCLQARSETWRTCNKETQKCFMLGLHAPIYKNDRT